MSITTMLILSKELSEVFDLAFFQVPYHIILGFKAYKWRAQIQRQKCITDSRSCCTLADTLCYG